MKISLARPNPGKLSTENLTEISRQISQSLWQRKTEKMFTSALLQGSYSEIMFSYCESVAIHLLKHLICALVGDGPSTVSESTVSNTELGEFFGPRVPGRELSEFLSAYYLCTKANSPSFSQNSPSLLQNSVRLSEFSPPKQYSRNSIPPVS